MKILQQLINITSYSGEEKAVQDFIFTWSSKLSCQVFSIKGNTILHIKGKNPQAAFICNAHVDTVREGTGSLWKNSPFRAIAKGEKIYGLGASDEKAGVAMCMLLAKYYSNTVPPCDFWCMFVNQEETTGSGSSDCLDWFVANYKQKYLHVVGLLPEPTGLQSIEIGHKGNAFIKLTVAGESGHGSEPDKVKINATLIMAKLLLELELLEKSWETYSDSTLGKPSIAAGTSITSGDIESPNKIADTCVAVLDVRTTPKLHNKTFSELKIFLKKYPVVVEFLFPPIPPGLTDVSDKLVKAAHQTVPNASVVTSLASTDLCFFSQYSIPAIIFGPGEKEGIHSPDEFCYPRKITEGVKVTKEIIKLWTTLLS